MIITELINSDLSKMSSIIRYSWIKTHNPQNLAEHSYYVVLIADLISEDILKNNNNIELDRYKVLKYAMYHDIEEVYTWDIITPVKYKSKTLLKELENIGHILLKEWLNISFENNLHIVENIRSYFNEYEENKYKNLENQIVKFSDQLEAFFYCISELKMWNNNFYLISIEILKWIKRKWKSNKYFEKYIDELDDYFYEFNEKK